MGVLDKIKEKKDKIKKIQSADTVEKKLELAEVEKEEKEKANLDLLTFEVEALMLKYYSDIIPDTDYIFFIPVFDKFLSLSSSKNFLVCAKTTNELISKINELIKKEEGKRYFVFDVDVFKSKVVSERIQNLWNEGKIGIFPKNADEKLIKEILDGNYKLPSKDTVYEDDDYYFNLIDSDKKFNNHFKIPKFKNPNFAKIISIK